ncbi:Disease resistance RPP8-like protein 3 [Abeliophyllum distichum]|uniref:Disease resistance RPP8-like protein 3 n=1 Tax=Abeliophyllum distichum TaxID=126358 RepID=A0ABD1RW45_9LAMI
MAYAALLSLTHVLEQTLNCDYQYLILGEKQQIASLLEKVSFLQVFLDNSSKKSIKKVECLESQIRDAAYKAEDIIESHMTDQVHKESASHREDRIRHILTKPFTWARRATVRFGFTTFFHKLEEVIKEIDSIKKRVEKIEDESDFQDQQQQRSMIHVESSRIAPGGKSTVVGFDDDLLEIKTRLIGGSSDLQTVALVGMGGSGKTTVAEKIYDDAFIEHYFDTRAWVTVSQNYNVQKILLDLLNCIKELSNEMHNESIEKLVELLYKTLKGRRYLIVMDDVWDTKFWDDASLKFVFPNDKNGSRIMLTTREEKVAFSANSCPPLHHMHFLDEEDSWKLFCEKVFGENCCPPELVEIGTKIVQHCKGLPLAIVVIGGALSKLPRIQHDWRNVAENLSSIITSNDERYSKIMSLSYNNLPHHLKGCFLYMGVFPEDFNIRVSTLVNLWIAEGFIKLVKFKRLEDVAEEYLLDLIERNLVIMSEKSSIGKIKTCKIHDLLRDLLLSEAEKDRFYHVTNSILDFLPRGTSLRRLSIQKKDLSGAKILSTSPRSPRSILSFLDASSIPSKVLDFRLLRVFHTAGGRQNNKLGPFTMRYFTTTMHIIDLESLKSWEESVYKFRNLQTLRLQTTFSPSFIILDLPPKLWKMTQLRHVQVEAAVNLPDPLNAEIEGENFVIVLENLQTLSLINDFRCTVEVSKRIPNLKKLGIFYRDEPTDWGYHCLNNLVVLDKLEALKCVFHFGSPSFLKNVTFPESLKKLTLIDSNIPWEDMTIIGSLPNLQVLKLKRNAFLGPEWEPNEGEFLQLKFLLLENVCLEYWRADSIHFPKLERLFIKDCGDLEEIPSGIGEITTLQSIEVYSCRDSLVTSAKQIQETQQMYGNDDLQIRIVSYYDSWTKISTTSKH